MKNKTFENYLQEQFIKTEPQVLDDDLTDAFDNWITDLDVQEVIDYAEAWGKLIIKL